MREALLHIEREGILARAVTTDFTVRGISEGEVRDVYQAREAMVAHIRQGLTLQLRGLAE